MALVEIARFHDPVEAQIARASLDAAGVPALLFDAGVSATFGGAVVAARLMVAAEDEADARAIVAAP